MSIAMPNKFVDIERIHTCSEPFRSPLHRLLPDLYLIFFNGGYCNSLVDHCQLKNYLNMSPMQIDHILELWVQIELRERCLDNTKGCVRCFIEPVVKNSILSQLHHTYRMHAFAYLV